MLKGVCFVFILLFSSIIPAFAEPIITDPTFLVETIATELEIPVQMEFIGNDLLILEKNSGKIRLFTNGTLSNEVSVIEPLYNIGNLGLLGITSKENTVYIYVSQPTGDPIEKAVNRIYQYTWNGTQLIDAELVNELPGGSGWDHAGGVMVRNSDDDIFAVIGDTIARNGTLQNNGGNTPDDTSIILKVGSDTTVMKPRESENPYDHYYAIGIRNSFGLAIDPITNNLWDTENGPEGFDEINLVSPKFNSGWNKIQGPSNQNQRDSLPKVEQFVYSDPEFSWEKAVAPTGIEFVSGDVFDNYLNSIFVSDFNTGTIYKFKLNSERTDLEFTTSDLSDNVFNSGDNIREIIFAYGFNGITDIEFGPDGNLYITSIQKGGTLYRVSENESLTTVFSPKVQSDSGALLNEIVCNAGYVLVAKYSTNDPACLTPHSVSSLVDRNWAKFVDGNISNKCNLPPQSNVDWSGCNFSFSDFRGIEVNNANLQYSNLIGADFSHASLLNSNFSRANSPFANFSNSDLSFSDFSVAKFDYVDLKNSILQESKFNSTNLLHSNLEGAIFDKSEITGSFLSYSDLQDASFREASMIESFLHFVNMDGAVLIGTDLENTEIYVASTIGTQFLGCKNHEICAAPDPIQPLVEITKPFPGEITNYTGDVMIEGIASDNIGVRKVEAFAHTLPHDGTFPFELATPITTDDWTKWSFKITIPDEQEYRVLVRVTDFKGNENWDDVMINSQSTNMKNEIRDEIIPLVEITKPFPGEITNYTGDVMIEGIASDNIGVRKVEAFAHTLPHDGTFPFELATPITTDDWTKWSFKITIPDEQEYRVLVRVTDFKGNENWDDVMINSRFEN